MNIGIDNEKKNIEISEEVRKSNLAVFGIKGTGKAFTFIPSLFAQDLEKEDKGITIIVNTPELSWYLYGMCKVLNRKVDILKPTIDFDVLDGLVFSNKWSYDRINKIYDYENAVKEKRVTIIDMEGERFGDRAIRACSMLLLQLQSVMIQDRLHKVDYSVYIDGAANYLPYISNLLKYGDFYGFETTMFFKSREELGEYKILIDNYVRNFILLQGLSFEDAKYFAERMCICSDIARGCQEILNRSYGEIIYEILDKDTFKRVVGRGTINDITDEQKKNFESKGKKLKRKFKNKIVNTNGHHFQLEEEADSLKTDKKGSYLEEVEKDVVDNKQDIKLPEQIEESNSENKIAEIPELQKEENKTDIKVEDVKIEEELNPEDMFVIDEPAVENKVDEQVEKESIPEIQDETKDSELNIEVKVPELSKDDIENLEADLNSEVDLNDFDLDIVNPKVEEKKEETKGANFKNNNNNKHNHFNGNKNFNKQNHNKKEKLKVEFKGASQNSGEPQLNKMIKTKNVEIDPKRTDYSLLDEFDLPDSVVKKEEVPDINAEEIEIPDNIPENIPSLEDIEEPINDFEVKEEKPATTKPEPPKQNKTYSIGNKNYPYRKLHSSKIERKLKGFKIN